LKTCLPSTLRYNSWGEEAGVFLLKHSGGFWNRRESPSKKGKRMDNFTRWGRKRFLSQCRLQENNSKDF